MAPTQFNTFQVVPEWACCKLQDHESIQWMSIVAHVHSTALYALRDRAYLQEGESVLINSSTVDLSAAAAQIAIAYGAKEIYATVDSESKKQFLVEQIGLDEKNIFDTRDASFINTILERTGGVDVILNNLSGSLLHESWKLCAAFGRFIEVGKRDIHEAGRLCMEKFKDDVTFSAFDLDSLYHSSKQIHHRQRRE
jgi:NADPH:quinone reductase-like Zn-dependent oxidoreductase